jgi:ATP-dependent DNA helicase RecG
MLFMARLPRLIEVSDHLNPEEFWGLLGKLEYEQLDFKESANHLSSVIAAMAMTDGGLLALGVADDRTLKGCSLDQKTLDRIMRTASDCGVVVQTKEIRVGDAALTIVAVPEVRGRIVTTPDGRLLRRVGSDNRPLTGDSLGRFVREREDRSGEDEPAFEMTLSDVDLDLVNQALAGDRRQRTTRRGLMRALVDLGVAVVPEPPLDPYLLVAGALVFGRDPTTVVPGAAVQVVRRTGLGPGPGPVTARTELKGALPRLLDEVLAFVEANTASREAIVGTHRERFPEYPPSVLREAILNAVAHRDYNLSGATVDVTIWDDRIEIQSPGPLPGHITVGNMRHEHYSRNRRTMRVLKLLSLVEEYGEGVDRMFAEMESRLMQPPHFDAPGASVTVTLYNRSILSIDDQAWLALLGHLHLTPAERRVLVVARHEDGVTPRRLRVLLGDEADVESLISSAVAKGLLVMVGRGGGARYVLSDEVVMRAGGGGVEARNRKRQGLLDEMARRGSISTAEASSYLGESDRTLVRHLLDDLVSNREAIAVGRTRGRRYYPATTARAHSD